jgi:hypothetical protein
MSSKQQQFPLESAILNIAAVLKSAILSKVSLQSLQYFAIFLQHCMCVIAASYRHSIAAGPLMIRAAGCATDADQFGCGWDSPTC